jgi:hypothetical protein
MCTLKPNLHAIHWPVEMRAGTAAERLPAAFGTPLNRVDGFTLNLLVVQFPIIIWWEEWSGRAPFEPLMNNSRKQNPNLFEIVKIVFYNRMIPNEDNCRFSTVFIRR